MVTSWLFVSVRFLPRALRVSVVWDVWVTADSSLSSLLVVQSPPPGRCAVQERVAAGADTNASNGTHSKVRNGPSCRGRRVMEVVAA